MSCDWLSPEEVEAVADCLRERFGIPPSALVKYRLFRRAEHVWAVRGEAASALEAFQWVTAGLKVLRVTGSGELRLTTAGAQLLGGHAIRGVCDVSEAELRGLATGRSLAWPGESGLVILRWRGQAIGMGVVRNGALVSQLPRSMTEHLRA